jgi:DNA-binding SARP family transcriptional activator
MHGMGRTDRITAAEYYARGPSDEVPQTVRIWLLGSFRVSVESRTIEVKEWRLKKAAGLVKLLALASNHLMHREQLMELLWPNLASEAAANNLRYVLYNACRTLRPAPAAAASRYLQLREELLELCTDAPLWVDLEAFEEAVVTSARRSRTTAAYEGALNLYSGDLLPEDRYEGWAEERREGLREAHLALLLELAELHEERGEAEEAIGALRRVLTADLTREEAHAGLMRLYALSGRRGEALGQYERLREALAWELRAEPSTASRRLREEISAGGVLSSRSPSVDPALESP